MDENREDRFMEELAGSVHAVLAAFHLLGIVYNIRKKNWLDVVVHGVVCAYDAVASYRHMKSAS